MEIELVDDVYKIVVNGTGPASEESAWSYLALSLGVGDDYMREAEYIASLLASGHTQKEIGRRVSKDQSLIAKRNRLNSLIEPLREKVRLYKKGGKMGMSANAGYRASELPAEWQEQLVKHAYVTIDTVLALIAEFEAGQVESEVTDDDELPAGWESGVPGLFLSGDEMESLLTGESIVKTWNEQEVIVHVSIR